MGGYSVEMDTLRVGSYYKIRFAGGRWNKGRTGTFKGKLLKEYRRFYLFENNAGCKECFLKVDFKTGFYLVEEEQQ